MTQLKELYKKDIDRQLNPAVSAEDFSQSTVDTEISEYVFTDDIINNLYQVLNAIWSQNVSHNGIWVNGFFGSGKSHFLKYLGYCVNPNYREAALARLIDAVKERDPLTNQDSHCEVTIDEINQLSSWIRKATIDIVLFNIGTVHDSNADQNRVFTQVFWNQFNRFRHYNAFNLALAQNLEKVLDQAGRFDDFKARLAKEGFDWSSQAHTLAKVRLDYILGIAKELVPDITVDSIRQAIRDNKENVSPEAFCAELKEYIAKKKDKNYRLLFLVDEVSQFINDSRGLMLQLQEVVTGLHNNCQDQAWVVCTAQQDLSLLLDNMQIHETSNDYGKIMGRFVKIALNGTQTEYITQKRLLDKNETGAALLHGVYREKKSAIGEQFALPSSFNAFKDETDFVNYYPFVPYQFKLMKMVLDSFGAKGFIDLQSRGNERSVIKITHSTALSAKDDVVGKFISFDRFYNAMFRGALKSAGQRAIENANDMVKEYADQAFAGRVVNILFMVCNLSDADKLLFPATQEFIVTLLMEDVDTNKADLIARTEKALAFLEQKHIIRTEKFADGRADIYCFQTVDEIEAAREIEHTSVDQATMAQHLFTLFSKHFHCSTNANRQAYYSRNFSIGWSIYGRNFFANNADITVEFLLGKSSAPDSLFSNNFSPNQLTFNVEQELRNDRLLVNDFYWYCQVQEFAKQSATQQRTKTLRFFSERALNLYNQRIAPGIGRILDRCEVLSGNATITVSGQGAARYQNALTTHFANVYLYARYAETAPKTLDELREKITRRPDPNEYGPLNPMSPPEQQVNQHLTGQIGTIYVSEVVKTFAARPFGWSEFATTYFLNELRRRQMWAFKYNNDPNIDSRIIAQNIIREQNRFTIIQAAAIPQELINSFVEAWKYALNIPQAPNAYDSAELFRACKEARQGESSTCTQTILHHYNALRADIAPYPFKQALVDVIALVEKWDGERDHKRFFEMVIADKEKAKQLFDRCKALVKFLREDLDGYKKMRTFVEKNADNFSFLADTDKVNQLQAIMDDTWPIDNMRNYAKAMRELKTALETVKRQKRDAIKEAYAAVFQELRQLAKQYQVDYSLNESSVITGKTASDNIYILNSNIDTSDFRAEQVKAIMSRRRPYNTNTEEENHSKVCERRVRMITLKTSSNFELNTEAAVDRYLAGLKAQLMEKVNSRKDNEDIMVK